MLCDCSAVEGVCRSLFLARKRTINQGLGGPGWRAGGKGRQLLWRVPPGGLVRKPGAQSEALQRGAFVWAAEAPAPRGRLGLQRRPLARQTPHQQRPSGPRFPRRRPQVPLCVAGPLLARGNSTPLGTLPDTPRPELCSHPGGQQGHKMMCKSRAPWAWPPGRTPWPPPPGRAAHPGGLEKGRKQPRPRPRPRSDRPEDQISRLPRRLHPSQGPRSSASPSVPLQSSCSLDTRAE